MAYNVLKAAQTVAFFILKNKGRPINTLKAVKLVYLADRASIASYGWPIQDEERSSMPHGPVNSTTYDHIKGEVDPKAQSEWNEFVSDRENHTIGISNPNIIIDDLDELSDADIQILDTVWVRFSKMNQWQLRDWTHKKENVPEWSDPGKTSFPISFDAILEATGCKNAKETAENYRSANQAATYLSNL